MPGHVNHPGGLPEKRIFGNNIFFKKFKRGNFFPNVSDVISREQDLTLLGKSEGNFSSKEGG